VDHVSGTHGGYPGHEPVDVFWTKADDTGATSVGRKAAFRDPASESTDAQSGALGGLGKRFELASRTRWDGLAGEGAHDTKSGAPHAQGLIL
jgi:hypothetical protein